LGTVVLLLRRIFHCHAARLACTVPVVAETVARILPVSLLMNGQYLGKQLQRRTSSLTRFHGLPEYRHWQSLTSAPVVQFISRETEQPRVAAAAWQPPLD
jgi:hypothetical protein